MCGFIQSSLVSVPVRSNRWLKSKTAAMLWCAHAAPVASTSESVAAANRRSIPLPPGLEGRRGEAAGQPLQRDWHRLVPMSRNIHEVGGRSIRIDKMDYDGGRLFDVAPRRPPEHWLPGVQRTLR